MQFRPILATLVAVLLMMSSQAQYVSNKKNAKEILEERNEIFFRFDLKALSIKPAALFQKISVDKVDIDEEVVYAYADKNGYAFLQEHDIVFDLLKNPSELIQPEMFSGNRETYEWDEYPTYDAYVDMMYQFEADYPDLCQVVDFGTTHEGRELLAAKISDNPDQDEQEPEFFYTSTMHGDETTGYVLMLRLIDYLLTNYGDDSRITDMVNNMEIWINPNANPDGTYASGDNSVNGATRGNANGIDLNRNFPDPQAGPNPDGNEYQAETEAFMDFAAEHDFVMSANHHGGAEVINYPWDTWSDRHADDDWYQMVSHEYADTAQEHSPSGYMVEFDDGITNGYDWYSITGGRQDYMNYFHHCREVTMELSDIKLLPENELDDHWEYNFRSLLNYIEHSGYGLRGVITETETGEHISGVKVEIQDHDEANSHVFSGDMYGDYYRPLETGTYTVTFSAPCYEAVTIQDVSVTDYEITELNVDMLLTDFSADFTTSQTNVNIGQEVEFEDLSCGSITSWEWTFEGGTPETSTEQNPVVLYSEPGEWDVTLTVSDGESEETTAKENYITAASEILMDDGEITTCQGMFYDDGGPEDDYSNDADYTFTVYPETDGAFVKAEFQSFNIEDHSSCDYDWLRIYDGESTSAPQIGGAYCGTDSPGTVVAENASGALTFEFHSDGSVTESGWEALISCAGGTDMPLADFEAEETNIEEGETVEFTNLSGNAEGYSWSFEGGTPATSSDENPVITYEEPGTYSVELVATNENGSDTELKEDYIEVDVSTSVPLSERQPLKVYPNPVSGSRFVIESEEELQHVEMINLDGKTVKSESHTAFKTRIGTNGLGNGVYILKITTRNNVYYKKIQLF